VRIAIIGCGYVGLVTGACLADAGHEVICTDNDAAKIAMISGGHIPIYEPHLDDLVAANRQAGRLNFTADASKAVRGGTTIFICVGTPPLESGDADLSAIDSVARVIATESESPKLVIEKSRLWRFTGARPGRAFE
jgi:UDPglucose 6-dehydrogenase